MCVCVCVCVWLCTQTDFTNTNYHLIHAATYIRTYIQEPGNLILIVHNYADGSFRALTYIPHHYSRVSGRSFLFFPENNLICLWCSLTRPREPDIHPVYHLRLLRKTLRSWQWQETPQGVKGHRRRGRASN